MKKKCSKCKKVKPDTEFYKDKKVKDGLYSACKKCHYRCYCRGERRRTWRLKNRVYRRAYQREWRKKNKERVRAYKRKSQRERRKSLKHRLDDNMKWHIRQALKGKKAGRKWEELVGYTVEDLMEHIERLFEDKMTWENYGDWHIDHIIPKSHFKYQTAEDIEFKKCWALENLQPLWAIENYKKGNRIK